MIDQSDLQSGCIVPLAQSATSGAFGALVTGALALLADQPTERAALLALAGGALAAAAVWLWRLRYWQTSLDLDAAATYDLWTAGDFPETGERQAVRVELAETDGANRRHTIVDLPGSPEQLQALAAALTAGDNLSQSRWTGAGAPFTRAEFATLTAELLRRGLARWNSPGTPARGISLTAPGRGVMRSLANRDN